MNEIKIFNHAEFGTIRTMQDEKGEPWFVGADIANMLGYTNPRKAIRDHVEEEDKTRNDSFLVNGTSPTFINESGLYALILSSKLPTAREFKHWVTSVVLPSIRKQGGYMVAHTDESDEVIMARAMLIMQATLERRDKEIARLQPRAEYADRVLDSVSCFTTTQLAKGMGMTAQELNRLLCLHGIQYGQSGQYMLYAPYARQGLATNRMHAYHDMFGTVHTTSSLVWTERGREFIYHLLNN